MHPIALLLEIQELAQTGGVWAAVRAHYLSACASHAAPFGGIGQNKHIQPAEQEQEQRRQWRINDPGGGSPIPIATKFAMTAAVKAIESPRWICRIHLFQFNDTSF